MIGKLVPVKEFEDDGHEVYGMKISYKKLWKQLIDEDMMKIGRASCRERV